MKPQIVHELCAICQGDKFRTFLATLTSGLLASVLTGGWEEPFCLIFHLSPYQPSRLATSKATGPQPLLMDYHQKANKLPFALLLPCHPSNWDTTKVTWVHPQSLVTLSQILCHLYTAALHTLLILTISIIFRFNHKKWLRIPCSIYSPYKFYSDY